MFSYMLLMHCLIIDDANRLLQSFDLKRDFPYWAWARAFSVQEALGFTHPTPLYFTSFLHCTHTVLPGNGGCDRVFCPSIIAPLKNVDQA